MYTLSILGIRYYLCSDTRTDLVPPFSIRSLLCWCTIYF